MIAYNGISLTYAQTLTHIMGPVKDPSGSDQLFTKIRFKVKALLYLNQLDSSIFLSPSNGDDSTVADTLTRIRHMLTAPRKPLFWDSSTPFGAQVPATPSVYISLPSGMDDANGPWPDPDAFSAVYVTPTAIEVTWACEVSLVDCQAGKAGVGGIIQPLSIRWSDSISVDKYWKATYHRIGTLIRSSLGADVESFRRSGVMLPTSPGVPGQVPPGFRRIFADYKISPDGLRCDFQFRDEQIRYAPAFPAIDMDIIQSETFPNLSGVRTGEVTVQLVGCQQASVITLADLALAILKIRLWAASPLNDPKTYAVLGNSMIRTKETVDGVLVTAMGTYKTAGNQQRETSFSKAFDFGLGPFAIVRDAINDAFGGGVAKPTGTGADPTANPKFNWIGAGTTPIAGQPPTDPINPLANSSGTTTITGPSSSVFDPLAVFIDPVMTNGGPSLPGGGTCTWGLGNAIGLFASILRDPCGGFDEISPSSSSPGVSGTSESSSDFIGGGGDFGGEEFLAKRLKFKSVNGKKIGEDDPGDGIGPTGSTSFTADVQIQGQTDPALLSAAYADIAGESAPSFITTISDTGLFYYDGLPGVYDFWQCMSEYEDDPGVIVMPTCNPNGINLAVQIASPQLTLRKRWAAKRTGAPPILPPKQSTDPNLIYVGGVAGLPEMTVGPDGVSIIYEAVGHYVYQALDPSKVQETAAIPPFLLSSSLTPANGWYDVYGPTGNNPQSGSGVGASGGGGVSGSYTNGVDVLGNTPISILFPN
jgi:hypothetical protein